MYNYHRNLKATHGYSSPWWQWPLLIRPIWMYQGQGLPEGKIASISSMGNPAIWWPGTLSLIACFLFGQKRHHPFFLFCRFLFPISPQVHSRLTFIIIISPFLCYFFNRVPYPRILENIMAQVFLSYLPNRCGPFVMFYPVISV